MLLNFSPEAWARMFSRDDDTVDCTHLPPPPPVDAMNDSNLPDGNYAITMRFYRSPGNVKVVDGRVTHSPEKCRWASGKTIGEVRDLVKQHRGFLMFKQAES